MMRVRRIENIEDYSQLLEEHFHNGKNSDEREHNKRIGAINAAKEDRYRGNLIISIVRRMKAQSLPEHQRFVVETDPHGEDSTTHPRIVRLLAVRTPPLPLVIGYGDLPATAVLADYFISQFPEYYLSGVIGPKHLAEAFCDKYLPATQLSVESVMKQLLHVLTDYTPPKRVPPGQWKVADPSDRELLISWVMQFAIDAKLTSHEQTYDYAEGLVEARLAEGSIYLWLCPSHDLPGETERPVSMAFASSCSDDMVRIGMVFTPASERNHGYASILVNLLSKWWMDQNKTCLLYTDSDNPVSNSIYYQIGYRVISDERVFRFT